MKKEPNIMKKMKKKVLKEFEASKFMIPGSSVNSSDLYMVYAQPTVLEIEKIEKKDSANSSKLCAILTQVPP